LIDYIRIDDWTIRSDPHHDISSILYSSLVVAIKDIMQISPVAGVPTPGAEGLNGIIRWIDAGRYHHIIQ
jgi:hypothetical protein